MNPCQTPYVITISHQIGSGGAAIGQKLSEKLGIPLIDHEILQQVSKKLHMAEAEVEGREERLSSFWLSFGRMLELMDPTQSLMVDHYTPTDRELFQTESETIRRIAQNKQAIFIGRCCRYILRDTPCHFSLLVHADRAARIERISSLYRLSRPEAEKELEASDRNRTEYIQTFTKQNWLNARLYDLCVNTTSVGMDKACDLVYAAVQAKLAL